MCLLTAPIVVKSNFWARIYVIFLKQALKKAPMELPYKILASLGRSEKKVPS